MRRAFTSRCDEHERQEAKEQERPVDRRHELEEPVMTDHMIPITAKLTTYAP